MSDVYIVRTLLPINTKSYNNLIFLPYETEKKLLMVIPALQIGRCYVL